MCQGATQTSYLCYCVKVCAAVWSFVTYLILSILYPQLGSARGGILGSGSRPAGDEGKGMGGGREREKASVRKENRKRDVPFNKLPQTVCGCSIVIRGEQERP